MIKNYLRIFLKEENDTDTMNKILDSFFVDKKMLRVEKGKTKSACGGKVYIIMFAQFLGLCSRRRDIRKKDRNKKIEKMNVKKLYMNTMENKSKQK